MSLKRKIPPKNYYTGKSKIHGKGVFAKKDFPAGSLIGKLHTIKPGEEYDFTTLGKNYNHSDTPNAVNIVDDKMSRHLVTTKDIKKGEELTADYRLQPDLEQPEDFGKPSLQDGGTIYTSDPNDPRLQAYRDSLDAYNTYNRAPEFGHIVGGTQPTEAWSNPKYPAEIKRLEDEVEDEDNYEWKMYDAATVKWGKKYPKQFNVTNKKGYYTNLEYIGKPEEKEKWYAIKKKELDDPRNAEYKKLYEPNSTFVGKFYDANIYNKLRHRREQKDKRIKYLQSNYRTWEPGKGGKYIKGQDELNINLHGKMEGFTYKGLTPSSYIEKSHNPTGEETKWVGSIGEEVDTEFGTGFQRTGGRKITNESYNPDARITEYMPQFKKPVQKLRYADPEIVAKQQTLKDAGLYKGELDGIWGPKSEGAWNKFKEINDVTTVGGNISYSKKKEKVAPVEEPIIKDSIQYIKGTPGPAQHVKYDSLGNKIFIPKHEYDKLKKEGKTTVLEDTKFKSLQDGGTVEDYVMKKVGWGNKDLDKSHDITIKILTDKFSKTKKDDWKRFDKNLKNEIKEGFEKRTGKKWDNLQGENDKDKYFNIWLTDNKFYDKINHSVNMYHLAKKVGPAQAKIYALGHEAGNLLTGIEESLPSIGIGRNFRPFVKSGNPKAIPKTSGDSGTDMRNNLMGIKAFESGIAEEDFYNSIINEGVYQENLPPNKRTWESLKEDWFGEHEVLPVEYDKGGKIKLQQGGQAGQPQQGFTQQEFMDKFGFDPTLETQEEIEEFQIQQSNLTEEQKEDLKRGLKLQKLQKRRPGFALRPTDIQFKDAPPPLGLLESFSASFGMGKDMIEQSFWEKMEVDAEQGVGFGNMVREWMGKDWLPGRVEENAEDVMRNQKVLEKEYEYKPLEFSDMWNNPKRFWSHEFPLIMGQAIPLVALPLGGTTVGGIAGALATGGPGVVPGMVMGGIAGSSLGIFQEAMSEAGDVANRSIKLLKEKHPDWSDQEIKDEAFRLSERSFNEQTRLLLLTEFPQLALNIFVPGTYLAAKGLGTMSKMGIKSADVAMKAMAKYPKAKSLTKFAGYLGGQALIEGGQEGAQYYVNENILNSVRDPEFQKDLTPLGLWDDPEFMTNVKSGVLMGVTMGVGFSALRRGFQQTVNEMQNKTPEEIATKREFELHTIALTAAASNKIHTLKGKILIAAEQGLLIDPKVQPGKQERIKESKKEAQERFKVIDQISDLYDSVKSNFVLKNLPQDIKIKALGQVTLNLAWIDKLKKGFSEAQNDVDKQKIKDQITLIEAWNEAMMTISPKKLKSGKASWYEVIKGFPIETAIKQEIDKSILDEIFVDADKELSQFEEVYKDIIRPIVPASQKLRNWITGKDIKEEDKKETKEEKPTEEKPTEEVKKEALDLSKLTEEELKVEYKKAEKEGNEKLLNQLEAEKQAREEQIVTPEKVAPEVVPEKEKKDTEAHAKKKGFEDWTHVFRSMNKRFREWNQAKEFTEEDKKNQKVLGWEKEEFKSLKNKKEFDKLTKEQIDKVYELSESAQEQEAAKKEAVTKKEKKEAEKAEEKLKAEAEKKKTRRTISPQPAALKVEKKKRKPPARKVVVSEEEIEIIETEDIPLMRRKGAITVTKDGKLKAKGFRTEGLGKKWKGVAQRGRGRYIAIDEAIPGKKITEETYELDPKEIIMDSDLEKELGVKGAQEDENRFGKNYAKFQKELQDKIDDLSTLKAMRYIAAEAMRLAYLEQGIKGWIGALEGSQGEQRELVLYDISTAPAEEAPTEKETPIEEAAQETQGQQSAKESELNKKLEALAKETNQSIEKVKNVFGELIDKIADKFNNKANLTPEEHRELIDILSDLVDELLKLSKLSIEKIALHLKDTLKTKFSPEQADSIVDNNIDTILKRSNRGYSMLDDKLKDEEVQEEEIIEGVKPDEKEHGQSVKEISRILFKEITEVDKYKAQEDLMNISKAIALWLLQGETKTPEQIKDKFLTYQSYSKEMNLFIPLAIEKFSPEALVSAMAVFSGQQILPFIASIKQETGEFKVNTSNRSIIDAERVEILTKMFEDNAFNAEKNYINELKKKGTYEKIKKAIDEKKELAGDLKVLGVPKSFLDVWLKAIMYKYREGQFKTGPIFEQFGAVSREELVDKLKLSKPEYHKENRKAIIEYDLAVAKHLTGIDWGSLKERYKQRFIQGKTKQTSQMTNEITTFILQGFQKEVKERSWESFVKNIIGDQKKELKAIRSQIKTAIKEEARLSSNIRTVAGESKSAIIEDNQITIDTKNILNKDSDYFNKLLIVQYYKAKGVPAELFLMDGMKDPATQEFQETGSLSPSDFMAFEVQNFQQPTKFQGKKDVPVEYEERVTGEYGFFIEQFGAHEQGVFVTVPKMSIEMAKEEYKKIINEIGVPNRSQMKSYVANTLEVIKGLMKDKRIGEEAPAVLAELFTYNFVVNKHSVDKYYQGTELAYTDDEGKIKYLKVQVKRSQPRWSNGVPPLPNVFGGLPAILNSAVVLDPEKIIEILGENYKKEIPDGTVLVLDKIGKQGNVSWGSLLSKGREYSNLLKVVYSKIDDNGNPYQLKSEWIGLPKDFTAMNPALERIRVFMEDNKIDVLAFKSAAKLHHGYKALELFEGENLKKELPKVEEGNIIPLDTRYLLLQQDAIKAALTTDSKARKQPFRHYATFPRTTAESLYAIRNRIVEQKAGKVEKKLFQSAKEWANSFYEGLTDKEYDEYSKHVLLAMKGYHPHLFEKEDAIISRLLTSKVLDMDVPGQVYRTIADMGFTHAYDEQGNLIKLNHPLKPLRITKEGIKSDLVFTQEELDILKKYFKSIYGISIDLEKIKEGKHYIKIDRQKQEVYIKLLENADRERNRLRKKYKKYYNNTLAQADPDRADARLISKYYKELNIAAKHYFDFNAPGFEQEYEMEDGNYYFGRHPDDGAIHGSNIHGFDLELEYVNKHKQKFEKEEITAKQWEKLSSEEKKEYKISPAEHLIPITSGLKIGDDLITTRTPFDGSHMQVLAKVVGFLPASMHNIMVVDPKTQQIAGEDNDGDERHIWHLSKESRHQEANEMFRLVAQVYSTVEYFKYLTSPIDPKAVDDHVRHIKENEAELNKYDWVGGHQEAYKSIKESKRMIGPIARSISVFDVLAASKSSLKKELSFPSIEHGKNKYSIDKDNTYTLQDFYNKAKENEPLLIAIADRLDTEKIISTQNIDAPGLQNIESMGLVESVANAYILLAMLGVDIKHIINYFNQPVIREFIKNAREGLTVANPKSAGVVLYEMLQSELSVMYGNPKDLGFEGSKAWWSRRKKIINGAQVNVLGNSNKARIQSLAMLTKLSNISKETMHINNLISATEKGAVNYGKFGSWQDSLDKILNKRTEEIDMSNLAKGKDSLVNTTYIFTSQTSQNLIKDYYELNRPIGTTVGKRVKDQIISYLRRIEGASFITSDQYNAIYNGLNNIWLTKALQKLYSSEYQSKEKNRRDTIRAFKEIQEKFPNNELIQSLEIETTEVRSKIRLKSSESAKPGEDIGKLKSFKHAFTKLPESFQNQLVIYNLYEYGFRESTFAGGFSRFISNKHHSNITEKLNQILEKWEKGEEANINDIVESIQKNNLELIPKLREYEEEKAIREGLIEDPDTYSRFIKDSAGNIWQGKIRKEKRVNQLIFDFSKPVKIIKAYDIDITQLQKATITVEELQEAIKEKPKVSPINRKESFVVSQEDANKIANRDIIYLPSIWIEKKESGANGLYIYRIGNENGEEKTFYLKGLGNLTAKKENIEELALGLGYKSAKEWRENPRTEKEKQFLKGERPLYFYEVYPGEKIDFYLEDENAFEKLRLADPKLANYIEGTLKKIYPFINTEAITDEIHLGLPVLGRAIARTTFIDKTKARQDTAIHEYGHLYWKALPDDNPVKKRLASLFTNEEAVIRAIGRAGLELAKEDLHKLENQSSRFTIGKFIAALKAFWRGVKKFFRLPKDAEVRRMAKALWKADVTIIEGKKNPTEADFVSDEMEYMLGLEDVNSKKEVLEWAEDVGNRLEAADVIIRKEGLTDVQIKKLIEKIQKILSASEKGEQYTAPDYQDIKNAVFTEDEKTYLKQIGLVDERGNVIATEKNFAFIHIVLKNYGALNGFATMENEKGVRVPLTGLMVKNPFDIINQRPATKDDPLIPVPLTLQQFFKASKNTNPKLYTSGVGDLNIAGVKIINDPTRSPEEISKIVASWTKENLEASVSKEAKNNGVLAAIEAYKQYLDDFVKLYGIYEPNALTERVSHARNISSLEEIYRMSKEQLSAINRQISAIAQTDVSKLGFANVLQSTLITKIYLEFIRDPKIDAFGSGYNLGNIALAQMLGLLDKEVEERAGVGKDYKIGRSARLLLSPKDYSEAVMQLKHYMIGVTNMAANLEGNVPREKLKKLSREIKKAGQKLQDIRIYDKEGILRFPDIYDEKEMKDLRNKSPYMEEWLRAYVNAILATNPHFKNRERKLLTIRKGREAWEKSVYEREVLYKMPVIEADFFSMLKKYGLFRSVSLAPIEKAIEQRVFSSSRFGNVLVKTKEGEIMMLEEARKELLVMKGKKKITSRETGKRWKSYQQKAEQYWKRGVDVEGHAIYNTTGLSVPLSGIGFERGSTISPEAVSENMEATVDKYIQALYYRQRMQTMIPMAHFFNSYYSKNDDQNGTLQAILKIQDELVFMKKKPKSDFAFLEKYIKFGIGWTAFRFLALNFSAMVFNISAGQTQNFIDMSPGTWAKGMIRYLKNPKKAYNIMKKMEVVNTSIDAELSLPDYWFRKLQNVSFILITAAENMNQAIPFIGAMGDKWNNYDTQGNIKPGKKEMTYNEIYLAIETIQRTHGAYHPLFKRQMNLTPEGMALMQFKGWLPEMFLRIWRTKVIDSSGNVRKGILQSFFDEESREDIMKVLKGKKKFSELSEIDKYNFGRGLRAMIMVATFMLLIAALDEDDTEERRMLRRALGDITYVFDINNLKFLLTGPFPVFSTVDGLLDTFQSFINAETYKQDSEGGKKGDLKFVWKAVQLMPYMKVAKYMYREE